MKKTCSWLLAVAAMLGLAGTTQAGTLPLIPLCLPQLFGQEAATQRVQPTQVPARDADRISDDCLGEALVDLLMEYAPEARALVHSLRPCTPYHIAAAAILEYLTAVDAAQQAGDSAPTVSVPAPSCPKDGPCQVRAVQSCPNAGSCPLANGNHGKVTYRITPDGHVQCYIEATQVGSCCKTGCCTVVPVDLTFVAEACDPAVMCCCQEVVQVSATAKACKCCEDCKDCKNNCTCAKSAVKGMSCQPKTIFIMKRCEGPNCCGPTCSTPVALPLPPPPPYAHMDFGFPLHPLMPPLPPTPFDELRELHMQRQMITSAIEQIEQELARLEMQKHVVLAPVVPSAQKVHLVTEQFEAHCESMHCVSGDPHRVVLQGDVRLTCKKCGQAVRIEAPRVVVNMKDGTFAVESGSPAVHAVHPMPPVMLWTPNMPWGHQPAAPTNVLRNIQWSVPGVPVPTHYQPAMPAETLPMPCPVGPVQRPVSPYNDDGDK